MQKSYIQGTVIDDLTGVPIEKAAVQQNGAKNKAVFTSQTGAFKLEVDKTAKKSIKIDAQGYKAAKFATLRGEKSTVPYVFRLLRVEEHSNSTQATTKKIPLDTNQVQTKKNERTTNKTSTLANKKNDLILYLVVGALVVFVLVFIYVIYKYNKKSTLMPMAKIESTNQVQPPPKIKKPIKAAPIINTPKVQLV